MPVVFEFYFGKGFYLFYLSKIYSSLLFVYAHHMIWEIITHEGEEIMNLKFVSIRAEGMEQQKPIGPYLHLI